MLAGQVNHKDTMGHAGAVGAGDVQWMTAGGGLMHEEMPTPRDGKMGGFQLWVNMPARLKMSAPRYQEIAAASIPVADLRDGIKVRVVAGAAGAIRGPVTEIYAEPEFIDVEMPPGATFVQPVLAGHNCFAYVFRGKGNFGVACDLGYRGDLDGTLARAPQLIVFGDGDQVRVETQDDATRFLLISGAPLGEPIARYGPFVMNTEDELVRAVTDLRADTFIWHDDPAWAEERQTWRG